MKQNTIDVSERVTPLRVKLSVLLALQAVFIGQFGEHANEQKDCHCQPGYQLNSFNTRRAGRPDNPIGNPLFEALRAKRRALAENVGVPPYVIFHDATLREMALTRPADIRALGRISGVGARKLEAYGAEFLSVIAQF